MADRRAPNRKTPADVLSDLVEGHREASYGGAEKGLKYLQAFSARNDSIPNAVKFFLYDLLADDAFQANDLEACRAAVAQALDYLPEAQAEATQRFREYSSSIRLFECGISLALDDGDFDQALSLCDRAIALGLGPAYLAKRASIERMM